MLFCETSHFETWPEWDINILHTSWTCGKNHLFSNKFVSFDFLMGKVEDMYFSVVILLCDMHMHLASVPLHFKMLGPINDFG